MSQLNEAVEIISEVLGLNLDSALAGQHLAKLDDNSEVKVSALQSKAIQTEIMKKFGCTKQTAYYYYFYRGKKAMSKDHNIKFVTDRSSPKRKKTADDVVADQLAKLGKAPASPFRI